MAVDRNTIVTLHKKGESKKLHIRRETVWKVVKKVKETVDTCNRPGQGRKRTVRTKLLVKNTREKLRKEFTSFCCNNGCRSRNQSNFNASNPQRKPQNLSLQNTEKAWTFNHSWTYETWQMSTHSESHDSRNGVRFGVHWWEEIWRSAMRKPAKWWSLE